MIPFIFIFAVLTEPPGSILETPWNYLDPIEVIDGDKTLQEIEVDLRKERKQ